MPDNEYDKIRKRECEGCAKGLCISEGFLRSGKTLHVVSKLGLCELCTAPSRDEVIERLAEAIKQTIAENLHLADGDNCTLRHLVAALKEEPNAR